MKICAAQLEFCLDTSFGGTLLLTTQRRKISYHNKLGRLDQRDSDLFAGARQSELSFCFPGSQKECVVFSEFHLFQRSPSLQAGCFDHEIPLSRKHTFRGEGVTLMSSGGY